MSATGPGAADKAARPRVVLSTIGRFHTVDLARELARSGHLMRLCTDYPAYRARRWGVPSERVATLPWIRVPHMALSRVSWYRRTVVRHGEHAARVALDAWVARTLPACDVVTALSSAGLRTGLAAHRRGAAFVCDRSSAHILEQDRLLAEEHDRLGIPYRPIDPRTVRRELAEYGIADAITVPSEFVRRSFVARGVDPARLHVHPLGVDLTAYRRVCPPDDGFRVLFVGGLDVRKGIADLVAAFNAAALPRSRLVLVGPRGPHADILLRDADPDRTELTGQLDQAGVVREMSRAAVLVLPSIEDGFGLVLTQAMACGCPVIASENTGGPTLFRDGVEGFVVPVRAPEQLAARLVELHESADLRRDMGAAGRRRTERLDGWADYARRSLDLFRRLATRSG